jgi:hypothetical protein
MQRPYSQDSSTQFNFYGSLQSLIPALVSLSKLTNLEIIIAQHLWIMTSQSLFLQSHFFTSAKEKGFRIYMICSAIAGAATRLLASFSDWGIDIQSTRSENEVYKFIERMLFEPKLDLMMTCGISPRGLLMRWHFCVCGCYTKGLGDR